MEKEFYLELEEEAVNYLQRLSFEVEGKKEIITRLFAIHANDTDASVLSSVPFNKYQSEFDSVNAEYNIAKDEMSKTLQARVDKKLNQEGTAFNWSIDNFADCRARITLLEN